MLSKKIRAHRRPSPFCERRCAPIQICVTVIDFEVASSQLLCRCTLLPRGSPKSPAGPQARCLQTALSLILVLF